MLRFTGGYPTRLPCIRRRRLTFGDRINLVVGHNGSGKSTVLRALGGSTGCGSGGWSREAGSEGLDFQSAVEWDGEPVFYQDCEQQGEVSFLSEDFSTRFDAARSSGERRIALLNELRRHLNQVFPPYRMRNTRRPTLVLDEVDHYMGIGGQWFFWAEIVPWISKRFQLILSSHSIFPVLLRKNGPLRQDTVLELSPGYQEECVRLLGAAVDRYNKENADNAADAASELST